jgi:hypothetical protein
MFKQKLFEEGEGFIEFYDLIEAVNHNCQLTPRKEILGGMSDLT